VKSYLPHIERSRKVASILYNIAEDIDPPNPPPNFAPQLPQLLTTISTGGCRGSYDMNFFFVEDGVAGIVGRGRCYTRKRVNAK
jgi:hypothetical protein